MRKMNKKGFTIVELVIVIAVIAILSAVLIPTFSGVVANAKNTSAKADAKAAYQQYLYNAANEGKDAEYSNFVYAYADDMYVVIKDGQVIDEVYTWEELDAAYTIIEIAAVEDDATTDEDETADAVELVKADLTVGELEEVVSIA